MLKFKDALALINNEYEAEMGLHVIFRRSDDVESKRIQKFIEAVGVIENHYEDKVMIEKDLVYRLLSFYTTLNASASHWKVSRPKGLDAKKVYEINMKILDVFASGS